MIEAVICVPSYLQYKDDQLAQRETLITLSLESVIRENQVDLEMARTILHHLRSQSILLDAAIYTQPDHPILTMGAQPSPLDPAHRQFERDTNTYSFTAALSQEQQDTVHLVVRYDAADIQQAAWAYAIRMICMILVIAAVVTIGSMIGIYTLAIHPILRIRQELLDVAESLDSELQCNLITSTQRQDELGDVVRAFAYLCNQTWQAIYQRESSHQAELTQRQISSQLSDTIETINRQQAQLIQTEKLVSLGRLAGGVAHEINNPVSFIHCNINFLHRYYSDLIQLLQAYQQASTTDDIDQLRQTIGETIDLEFIQTDLPQILASMNTGTQRISTIVKALQNFSSLNQAGQKLTNITQSIDDTLILLGQRLLATSTRPDIQVVKTYTDVFNIECQPDLINQVFLSILNNAIDAIERESPVDPKIYINVAQSTQDVLTIAFSNNGPALNVEDVPKLFEPFFSTKELGQGIGFSLFNSYQIICQQHGGQLSCANTDPVTFVIELPYKVTHSSMSHPQVSPLPAFAPDHHPHQVMTHSRC